jgi:hypothetical protein
MGEWESGRVGELWVAVVCYFIDSPILPLSHSPTPPLS